MHRRTQDASIVIPAHNEEDTIAQVVESAVDSGFFDEVVVINDASTDSTAVVADRAGARVCDINAHNGKAYALKRGVNLIRSDIVLFWDADVLGVKPRHFWAVLDPVVEQRADMSIGVLETLGQRLAPNWSGQRAMRVSKARDFFEANPATAGYTLEQRLTEWAGEQDWQVEMIELLNIGHYRKEEKRGVIRGFINRMKMYSEIAGHKLAHFYRTYLS